VVAYGLLYVMKWISSSEVVLILVSIPFWTCLFGLFLLDEPLSPYTALGAFFIVCGIAVYAMFPPVNSTPVNSTPVNTAPESVVVVDVVTVLADASATTIF
jgi:drug/metabolite transporter (DMT)-like permease